MKKNSKINNKQRLIDQLNFSQLKSKLRNPEEGKGWTIKQCNQVEKLYKQFLKLLLFYPNASIVPTKLIDDFWHAHILDTRRYHDDCKRIFGEYIHHYPYFGLRGKKDAKDLHDSFDETKQLWVKEFGAEPTIAVKQSAAVFTVATHCNSGGGGSTCNGRCRMNRNAIKTQSSLCSANCKIGDCRNCVSSCKKKRSVKNA